MNEFDEFCKKHELTNNLYFVEEAWNHQQKKIDEMKSKIQELWSELDDRQ